MTDKVVLSNLVNLQNETTAVNTINANNAAITTAITNTLSRNGTSPNQMNADFDMNSNHILNLPLAINIYEPLRVIDATTLNGGGVVTVSPIPSGGTTGQLLSKNSNTNYDVGWSNGITIPFLISPPIHTNTQGLLVNQVGPISGTTVGNAGTNASGGNSYLAYNEFAVTEGANVTGGGVPYTTALNVGMTTGGLSSTSQKSALNVFLYTPNASAPAVPRDTIAGNFGILADAGDGGTGTSIGQSNGSRFAASFGSHARSGATNLFEVAGMEVDVGIAAGASATYRMGINIVDSDTVQGSVGDGAIVLGSVGVGWKNGLLFASYNGQPPISANGTAIGTDGLGITIANGMDLSSCTITGNFLKGPNGFSVSGVGNITAPYLTLNSPGLNNSILITNSTDGVASGVFNVSGLFSPSIAIGASSNHNLVFLNNNVLSGYFDTSHRLNLGLASISQGVLRFNGLTSGIVTVGVQAAAGTYNFNLPTTAGTAGQFLTSQGGVATAMTWSDPGTAAAGSLTGTTLAAGVVSSSLTSVGTLTGGSTGAGFTIALGTSTVTGNLGVSHLNSGTGASSSTFWRGDGTWVTPAGAGTVTSIVIGTGLSSTQSPLTTTGTLSLANTAVTPASYGSSTSIPSFTVDAQGRLTAAAGNVVIAPAGTLSGTTLASGVVASSLTSTGTLTGGSTGAGFTVALGTSTLTGNLPIANLGSGSGASSFTFWRGDGSWATPAGSGNVTGPGVSTANGFAVYSGTTGTIIKDHAATISLSTEVTGTLQATNAPSLTGDVTTSAGSLITTVAKIAGVSVAGTTGTTNAVFSNSPTLVTPILGAATVTTINKVTFTAPATGSTLTVDDGKTLRAANTITFASAPDNATITLQGTGTYLSRTSTDTLTNKTYDTAGTGNSFKINGTSISTVTGTGDVVLSTTPVFVTNATVPLIIGGTGAASTLTLESTSGTGTTDAIIGKTGSQVERFRVTSAGQFNIGSTGVPDTLLTVNANTAATAAVIGATTVFHSIGPDNSLNRSLFDSFGGSVTLDFRRANGTLASPTGITNGQNIFAFGVYGYGATGYSAAARLTLQGTAAETWTDSAQGTVWNFVATIPGTTTSSAVASITGAGIKANTNTASTSTSTGALTSAGGLGVAGDAFGGGKIVSVSPTAGVGYATGAGGTVTQATSKSTGVTLNTVSGAVTMNAAALTAGTIVSFVLTNSAIAATDVLILNHISGGTVGSYLLNAQCAAGSATINVRNETGGSLSEAIVIQFVLIKGVNS